MPSWYHFLKTISQSHLQPAGFIRGPSLHQLEHGGQWYFSTTCRLQWLIAPFIFFANLFTVSTPVLLLLELVIVAPIKAASPAAAEFWFPYLQLVPVGLALILGLSWMWSTFRHPFTHCEISTPVPSFLHPANATFAGRALLPTKRRHLAQARRKAPHESDRTALLVSESAPSRPAGSPADPHTAQLRVVHLSDTHMDFLYTPASRLRALCERVVSEAPDLVLLTGDFLTRDTMSPSGVAAFAWAMAPLQALAGRAFACLGNHDAEIERDVVRALESAGVTVLRNRWVTLTLELPLLADGDPSPGRTTRTVHVAGFDFFIPFETVTETLATLRRERQASPARSAHETTLVLLHNPFLFGQLPPQEGVMVFCGHTHGGHFSLQQLGLHRSVLRPDRGPWALGSNLMYVSGCTGIYGWPARVFTPSEQSMLWLTLPAGPSFESPASA
ncbi:hypothetical protein PAPYR_4407 [Paratrimastix pyriformis]|uniref:Calcineurin-like phosphoesterase domain-containing protein n=1 Tax=Paratrimastix pyriformis TaxID=342808 RepID=A0ABQ8UKA7_9EUKA|nr:hypothetical protein PAPYR_4407 [Paratrimastix pyriformis]